MTAYVIRSICPLLVINAAFGGNLAVTDSHSLAALITFWIRELGKEEEWKQISNCK
jgi:hypothetical protein